MIVVVALRRRDASVWVADGNKCKAAFERAAVGRIDGSGAAFVTPADVREAPQIGRLE